MADINHKHVEEAKQILLSLGMPEAQRNERSALCLLALLNLTPEKSWDQSEKPLIGITPMMEWIRKYYGKKYAPNSRETVRRHTMHQFVEAGIALYNPDNPKRPVNSPKAVYQIAQHTFNLLRSFGTVRWNNNLTKYLSERETLLRRYSRVRERNRVPVEIAAGKKISLSPGEHSELIRAVIEGFGPRFAPGSKLIYVGDTEDKWAYFDAVTLGELGVKVDKHGKMPDVVLYDPTRDWLYLVESVTSHGPVDSKRHAELARLFKGGKSGLVFVTAFPDRATMARYISDIAWETEVWIADNPSHMIHFNGECFLGPHFSSD